MVKINPMEIKGKWSHGYALDLHTTSSVYLGQDQYGHDVYDTTRSPIGELVYKLKYGNDQSVIPEIVETILDFAKLKKTEIILPVPPSNTARSLQPVFEIVQAMGKKAGIPVSLTAIKKIKETAELKGVDDPTKRAEILKDAFEVVQSEVKGKAVLLIDDLYRSGSSLNALTKVLLDAGAKYVNVIALTKTRTKS